MIGNLLKNSSLLMAARAMGAALGLASQVAVARLLGPESLGQFYVAISLAGVLAILCGLGYPSITARYVSEYRAAGKPRALAAFLASARREAAMTSAALMALVTGLVLLWPTGSTAEKSALLLGVLAVPAFAFGRLNGAVANANRRYLLSYLPDLLARPALLLAAIGGLATLEIAADARHLLALHLAIVCALALSVHVMVRRLCEADAAIVDGDAPEAAPPGAAPRAWRRHALPMVVVALFTALFADVAILVVGWALPASETAIFGVSVKVALLLGFGIQAVHQLTLPDMADAHVGEGTSAMRACIARANLVNVTACLAATLLIALAGDRILQLFGPGFVEGRTCLLILAFSQLYRAAAGPGSQLLSLTGRTRRAVPVFAVCLALLVALGAVLAPAYGLEGAAVAVFVVTVLWTTWLAVLARQETGVRTDLIGAAAIAPVADAALPRS